MPLVFNLESVRPGADANRIAVEFVVGTLGVIVTESDFNTFLITVAVGSGTWSDVASAIAGSAAAALVTMTVLVDGAVTGGFFQLSGGSEGNGPGQYYSGVGGARGAFLPRFIKYSA